MSTDPTQPMSQPASAGADWPEQPESQQREVPDATRAEPSAQPSFQPAQPSFTPAQPGSQPPVPPAPPASPQPPAPQQPPQYSPQPGWPDRGGANTPPGGTPQWQAPGRDSYPGAPGPPNAPGAPGAKGGPKPRRRRRRRRWTMVVFGVIVLLILLVIGDRVALAVAENAMAEGLAFSFEELTAMMTSTPAPVDADAPGLDGRQPADPRPWRPRLSVPEEVFRLPQEGLIGVACALGAANDAPCAPRGGVLLFGR